MVSASTLLAVLTGAALTSVASGTACITSQGCLFAINGGCTDDSTVSNFFGYTGPNGRLLTTSAANHDSNCTVPLLVAYNSSTACYGQFRVQQVSETGIPVTPTNYFDVSIAPGVYAKVAGIAPLGYTTTSYQLFVSIGGGNYVDAAGNPIGTPSNITSPCWPANNCNRIVVNTECHELTPANCPCTSYNASATPPPRTVPR
jgi:hypothetical protein